MAMLNAIAPQQRAPVDIALEYAAKGWPVFPCRPCDDFDSETGEVLPEKAPLISNGFRGATLSERIIRELWKRYPGALVGVPTGERSGFWVLDVDTPPKHEDGRPWLRSMETAYGDIITRQAETGNGGLHFLFSHVHGIRNSDVATGVETRGEGGYFIAPGSTMEDGRAYAWLNDEDINEAPQWLLDLLLKPRHEPSSYIKPEREFESASSREIEDLLSYVSPDCGYQDWVNVLMAIHSALGVEGLLIAETWSAGGKKYRQGEVARKWRGFQAGGGVNLGSLAELARQGGADLSEISRKHRPGNDNTPIDNTTLRSIDNIIAKALRQRQEVVASEPVQTDEEGAQPEPVAEEKTEITATAFKWLDPSTIPRREFVFGTHYIRKYVSVTVSPGGLGKTSNSIAEVASMVSGGYIMREKKSPPMNVWLFNAEDPRDEMERRIMAACIHYNLKPEDIEGRLFLDTGREQELVIAKDDRKTGLKIIEPVVDAIVRQIIKNKIDVMIIDPFVSTHGVNENDNGAIDKVAKTWALIADRTNCAIDVVHHLRKVSDRDATVEDARGAVALIGAARSVRVLNRMSEEQATSAGINPNDRFGYFNITYGKSNLTPMSHRLDWRKLEGVGLGNGTGLTKPQDKAPVVTEWRWPDKAVSIEEVSDAQRSELSIRVSNGECKLHHQAKDWVGVEIAYVMGWDLADKAVYRRVRQMVDAWLEEGFFVVTKRRDPVKREMKDYVEIGQT